LYGTPPALPHDLARFQAYSRRKEELAATAHVSGFETVGAVVPPADAVAIGNDWTHARFDGPFYVTRRSAAPTPALSLIFVQSRDGNTGADDPSTLGGGDSDAHLVYEGLSRVAADGVMAGATTARGEETVFSVWHPQLVALRRDLGLPRHPAQIVITNSGDLPYERGLMFTTPELRVWLIAPARVAASLRLRLEARPWIGVIDTGETLDLHSALRQIRERGVEVISGVGGRRTATQLIREGLVNDLYLTTAPVEGGEPHTPYYGGAPLSLDLVLEKAGKGDESGVRFQHFRLKTDATRT
jgi:riboflavin biosynthesis pyrimidine reductase